MFGQYAVHSLGPDAHAHFGDPAAQLLEGLINRAMALETGLAFVVDQSGPNGNPAEHRDRLRRLCAAVEVFLEEVAEARVRGIRAELFTPDQDCSSMVCCGNAVCPSHLVSIGADWQAVKDAPDAEDMPPSYRKLAREFKAVAGKPKATKKGAAA